MDLIYFLFVAMRMRSSLTLFLLTDIVCTYKGYLFLYISLIFLTFLIFLNNSSVAFLGYSGKESYTCNNDTSSASFSIFIYSSFSSNCVIQSPPTILIDSYDGGKQTVSDTWGWEYSEISH